MKFRDVITSPHRLTQSILLILFVVISLSATAQAQSTLAEHDYMAYKSTKFASARWNKSVKEGIEAFHAENYELAHQNLFKAFNMGCESPIVTFMLALISEANESYYTAVEMYRQAQKGFQISNQTHRYNEIFYENYGRALYMSGKVDEAMPVLSKAAKKSKSYWLLKLMGMLAVDKGDTLNAVAYLERAVRQKTPDVTTHELVQVYTMLARLFLQQGETDGARRYYQQIANIDPTNVEASQFLSKSHKGGVDPEVKAQLEKLLED